MIKRAPIVVNPEHSLREAADHMVTAGIGRVIVVTKEAPRTAIGILTRSDLLAAHAHRLHARGERTT